MFTRLNKIYYEFPRLFWVVVGVRFIDGIGGTLLFPFFALYITQKFGVGMTEAGILLGISSLFGLVGGMFGGALTDKFGRKQLILFGLVFSAISTLTFGLVTKISVLYPLVIVVGLLSNIASCARGDDRRYPPRRKAPGGIRYSTRRWELLMDHRSHDRGLSGEH